MDASWEQHAKVLHVQTTIVRCHDKYNLGDNQMGSVKKLRIFNFEGQQQDSYEGTNEMKVPNRRVGRVSQDVFSDEKEQRYD